MRVSDYHTLDYVRKALELTDTDTKDLIVMTVQVSKGPDTGYVRVKYRQSSGNVSRAMWFSALISSQSRVPGKGIRNSTLRLRNCLAMAAGNLDGTRTTRTTPMNTDIKYIIYPCSSVQSVYSASHPKSLNNQHVVPLNAPDRGA
jgi:hypothetical protein